MSLLDEYMNDTGKCVFIDRISVSDGRGGIRYTYIEGAPFDAAIYLSNSLENATAEKQGVTGLYQVTVHKNVRFEYHNIFKRLKDGKTFRITSKDESSTPASSALDMRVVRAEEYTLPIDGSIDG